MSTKHDTTTNLVLAYVREHPGESMEEIAIALHISSRANVLYHLRKLVARGLVTMPKGKHRMFRCTEVTQ
jgi:predicted ArsR family transcriptional regulator